MILTKDNSTEMARNHIAGAMEFEGAYFHGNEVTYASSSHDGETCVAYCVGSSNTNQPADNACGWERTYEELGTDDIGYYTIPPLCPHCFQRGDVSGVRTTNPDAKPAQC